MNSHPASHVTRKTSWRCLIVRQWSALRADDSPPHAASCADCRQYFASLQQLENSLRTTADRPSVEEGDTPSAFEQRILRAVRNAPAATERPATRAWLWATSGLSIAAAAALVLGPARTAQRSPVGSDRLLAQDAQAIVSAVESLSNGLVDSVIPSAGEIVAGNPLQQELGSVYSDARSALNFLAMNFLPNSPKPAAATAPQI
jgi:hypothetical protein